MHADPRFESLCPRPFFYPYLESCRAFISRFYAPISLVDTICALI